MLKFALLTYNLNNSDQLSQEFVYLSDCLNIINKLFLIINQYNKINFVLSLLVNNQYNKINFVLSLLKKNLNGKKRLTLVKKAE